MTPRAHRLVGVLLHLPLTGLHMYATLSLCETIHVVRAVQNASAVSLHVQHSAEYSACSVHTGYVFFGTLDDARPKIFSYKLLQPCSNVHV